MYGFVWSKSDNNYALAQTLPTHKGISVHTHTHTRQHVWLQCVPVWLNWQKDKASEKEENGCECGITAGIISIMHTQHIYTHTQATGTLFLQPTVWQVPICKTYTPTHKLYMHRGRETNSPPVMRRSAPRSGPYRLESWTTNNTHPSQKFSFNDVTSHMINLVSFLYHMIVCRIYRLFIVCDVS